MTSIPSDNIRNNIGTTTPIAYPIGPNVNADVFDLVEKSMNVIEERLSRLDIEIELRPELTGKTSQFGSLNELISLTKSVATCSPCMDFSHLYARTGEYNTYEEFCAVLDKLKADIGDDAISNMHIHISPH